MVCRLGSLLEVVDLDFEVFEMFLFTFSECSLGSAILFLTFLRLSSELFYAQAT